MLFRPAQERVIRRQRKSARAMPYRCSKCRRVFTKEELERLPWVRCPYCDSRVIYKVRPPVVKRIKAL